VQRVFRQQTDRFVQEEEMRIIAKVAAVVGAVVLATVGMATYMLAADSGAVTVKGYVLDSACAFTKDLQKPISKECAVACAKAGSALVILAEDGTIYWPIADTTPSSGQNGKLLPFAGEKVTASGKVYDRGGSKALVILKIEAQK
jgi:type 1 fimbria pilin